MLTSIPFFVPMIFVAAWFIDAPAALASARAIAYYSVTTTYAPTTCMLRVDGLSALCMTCVSLVLPG